MGKAIRASFVAATALIGGALGAVGLGYTALAAGFFALSFAPRGIHSDWSMLALLGVVVGIGLGGLLGIWAGVTAAKFLLREKQTPELRRHSDTERYS